MRLVVGVVVVACAGACTSRDPLSLREIRECVTPDTGIAVPIDSAAYAASAQRCLDARGR